MSEDEGADNNAPTIKTRIRSRVACRGCNQRKVRCDVTRTGIPCSNCVNDSATCEVLPRKKHRPRRDRATLLPSKSPADHVGVEAPRPAVIADPCGQGPTDGTQNAHQLQPQVDRRIPHHGTPSASPFVDSSRSQVRPFLGNNEPSPVSDISKGPSASLDPEGALPDDNPLSYIGDRRGPRFFVYDLCYPESPQDATPYLLPRASDTSWKPHEIEYLHRQGAFTTFSDEICDALIRCYFHHVHFFLPVVDAASFLAEYDNNGRQNISLLLFWSMLLAAANFVETDVLQKAGFSSRKTMKTTIYERAKCLYDLDHGTDKLVLIQSVILMGFWYTDPQDHTGAWYWIGVAITLSQSIGLHRSPQLNDRRRRLDNERQSLVNRIWWSCLVRDRWLSLAKGRPMRIHQEDCDVRVPVAEDILDNLNTIPIQTKSKFIPADSEILAKMWINLVEISASLGTILRIHYRAVGPKPTVEEIDRSAEELRCCKPKDLTKHDLSSLILLHEYHVQLFYEAAVAILYRPYILMGSPVSGVHGTWQTKAIDCARVAASNTNSILENIIELNAIHLLKPMMITTLIPAMQIHLFDCKSMVPLRRGLGRNKLALCMLVLSQLRDTYWSASMIYRLFERAQIMIDNPKPPPIINSAATPTTSAPENQNESRYNNDPNTGYQNHRPQQLLPDGPNNPNSFSIDSNLLLDQNTNPSWLTDFNHVDQLLNPGFSMNEDNMFQPFFTGYDYNGLMSSYDPIPGNNPPADGMYHV